MGASAFSLWVGIDWGSQTHQVCGVDEEGHKTFECEVKHEGKAIGDFIEQLLKRVDGRVERVAVAIEAPHGSIVEALMERGVAAFFLNPKQLDRFRDRHSISGAKSDRLDAFVLATSLRTDLPLYRRIAFGEAELVELRELHRVHEALTADRTALGARLWAQLQRYYPQMLALGSPVEDGWICALLEMAPTPAQGARLSLAKLGSLLQTHRIRRLTAQEVYDKLREKPLVVAPGVVAAASQHAQLLLPMIRLVRQQLADCDHRIEALLEPKPSAETPSESEPVPDGRPESSWRQDARLIRTIPGIGVMTCAALLSEAATALRDRDYQSPAHAIRRRARALADGPPRQEPAPARAGGHAEGLQRAPPQRHVPLGPHRNATRARRPRALPDPSPRRPSPWSSPQGGGRPAAEHAGRHPQSRRALRPQTAGSGSSGLKRRPQG